MRKLPFASLLIFSLLAATASATSFTYTERVTASGTIGSTHFTNAPLTFTTTGGDTSDFFVGMFEVDAGSISPTVTIGTFGTFAFTDSYTDQAIFRDFLPGQLYAQAVFFDIPSTPIGNDYQFDIFIANTGVFQDYLLNTSLGPITGAASLGDLDSVATSGGRLTITSLAPTGTFQAQLAPAVTPEPSTLLLLSTGLLWTGGLLRKRRA